MSGGGKKKSGFQITSVTSDYQAQEGGGPRQPPEAPDGAARNGPSAPPASRFRLVKLAQGGGEPYRRGRWTCRDFYEPEAEPPPAPPPPPPAAARHPQSLDSRLEVAGLLPAPARLYSPQPQRRRDPGLPCPGPPARSLGGSLPLLARPDRPPPSPGALRSPLALALPGGPAKTTADEPPPPAPRCQVLPREPRSRPSSPAPALLRDASPSRRTSDPFSAARFSLARSMLGMGAAHDSDDDSGTNNSMIAIDNKIEQAMDLVKSHLMFAVREEVEVLREQIKELSERNALLEQENALLRSLASAEQISRLQAQLHAAKSPPSSTS